MKLPAVFAAVAMFLSATLRGAESRVPELREGDIVFSSSVRGQGGAIMAATGSPYTHCGIVFEKDGKLMVLEAVQPVGVIPLETFVSRSNPGTFMARRLTKAVAAVDLKRAREWAVAQIGKDYDGKFLWDDDRLYCSELVWKAYQKAGVNLCVPRHFKDYQLDDPRVREFIIARFGSMENFPREEKVVAPSDLAVSKLLAEIK